MLKYIDDIRTCLFCVLCTFSYIFFWWHPSIIGFFLTSLQAFQMSVIVHNCAHTSMFIDAWMNRVFQIILTVLSGSPVTLYIPGHNESHHKHLESEKDMMRTSRMTYKHESLNLLLFLPTVLCDIIENEQNYMKEKKKISSPIYVQYLRESVIYHFFLMGLFFINWKKALIVYFIPTLVGKYFIISLNMLQHYKCDPSSKFNHSRNFTGPILNFIFLNNGYHTMHHIAPGLHWSKLPMKHKEIESYIDVRLIHSNIFYYIYCAHF